MAARPPVDQYPYGNSKHKRWKVRTGPGVGRYLGLNTGNSAVIDNLRAIDQTGWFVACRFIISVKHAS